MKRILLLVLSVFILSLSAAEAPQMTVKGDERVELLSLVFKLAGNPEYQKCAIREYDRAAKAHFMKFASHPVIQMARELRSSRGVSFDAVMSMAVHLDNAADCGLIVPREDAKNLESRWPRERVPEFLDKLRSFSKESSFRDFYTKHKALYEKQEQAIGGIIAGLGIIPWVEQNFSGDDIEAFRVIPAFFNGQNNYGARTDYGKERTCYAIIGMMEGRSEAQLQQAILYLGVHEFLHAFANPLVNRNYGEMKKDAERIYAVVGDAMRRMAYSNAKTMMCETFVRAATCLYVLDKQGKEAADKLAAKENSQFFLLVPSLYECMAAEREAAGEGWSVEKSLPAYLKLIGEYADRDEFRK